MLLIISSGPQYANPTVQTRFETEGMYIYDATRKKFNKIIHNISFREDFFLYN